MIYSKPGRWKDSRLSIISKRWSVIRKAPLDVSHKQVAYSYSKGATEKVKWSTRTVSARMTRSDVKEGFIAGMAFSKKKEMTKAKDRDERRTNDDPILKALDKEEE